jgi:hypothetical protein
MTPTLYGRWQTRLFLLTVIGIPLTAVFALFYGSPTPFALLAYVLLLGFGWDVLYDRLQTYRWNRDWPPLFVLLGGLWEGFFLWVIISLSAFMGVRLPGISVGLMFGRFAAHYLTVFLITWAALYSLLPILFPRWRFRGGQWW